MKSHNLKSETHLLDKVTKKLNKEIELERFSGSFSSKPLPTVVSHQLA